MRTMRFLARAGAFIAVWTLGVALAAHPSRAASGGAAAEDNSLVVASIRDRVHMTASSVPPFPMDDRRLLKSRDWPETMTIGGVLCARRIHGLAIGDARALQSVKRRNGLRLILFYDRIDSKWNSASAGWGPRYSWDQHDRLTERIWYEPDSTRLVTRDYTYYQNGRLLGYSWRSEPRHQASEMHPTSEFLSEFFDQQGRLIAVAYEKTGGGERSSHYSWMGAPLTYDDFRMRSHVLFASANP